MIPHLVWRSIISEFLFSVHTVLLVLFSLGLINYLQRCMESPLMYGVTVYGKKDRLLDRSSEIRTFKHSKLWNLLWSNSNFFIHDSRCPKLQESESWRLEQLRKNINFSRKLIKEKLVECESYTTIYLYIIIWWKIYKTTLTNCLIVLNLI